MPPAGSLRRRSASHWPASRSPGWSYQRRAINADSLAALFSPIRRAALAKFWIDDLFEGVLGVALLAFSRLIGWIDRYLVDGVLNVVSAWTVIAGDDAAHDSDGHGHRTTSTASPSVS